VRNKGALRMYKVACAQLSVPEGVTYTLREAVHVLESLGATDKDVDEVASLWEQKEEYKPRDKAFTVRRVW
jgi:hypothetical protein